MYEYFSACMCNFLLSYMSTYNNELCSLKKKQVILIFYSSLPTTTISMTKRDS